MTTVAPGDRERLLGAAADGDVPTALDLVGELVDRGVPVDRVLAELVVPVQVRVGELWEADVWSVAQEHTATAVVDAVVGQLDLAGDARQGALGRIGVVCAEGEWHGLPARVAATGLRVRGLDVRFVGASVPAGHLARAAGDAGWEAAVLFCSVPMFLPGAQRSIAALHRSGVPVVAGGRGFGPDHRRARRLGADAWAADLDGGTAILHGWRADPPPPASDRPVDAEVFALEAALDDLVAAVLEGLQQAWPPMRAYDATQLERTREDVGYLFRFVLAGIAADDRRIPVDYVRWAERVLGARGIPGVALQRTLRVARTAVPPALPQTRALLAAVVDSLPMAE